MKFLRIMNQNYKTFTKNDRTFLTKNVMNLPWKSTQFDDYFYCKENAISANLFIMNDQFDEDDREIIVQISNEEYNYFNLKFT